VLRHGVSEGEVDLLRKPFTPDALRDKLRRMLDGSKRAVPPATKTRSLARVSRES
jgi:DNA-binding response OmpR family regulator